MKKQKRTEVLAIFATYFCIHSFNGLNSPFFPLFLEDMGFDVSARGLLLAVGPVIAILAQPIWGRAGDRAKNKSSVLHLMAAGMILVTLVFLASCNDSVRAVFSSMSDGTFTLLFVLTGILLYYSFQPPMQPMADTITMEYIYEKQPWFSYGVVRATGTIAFAIMSYAGGLIIQRSSMGTAMMFPIQMVIAVLMVIALFGLPVMPGKSQKQDKAPASELFRDPWFVVILLMALTTASTMGFYVGHFSTYLRGQLHAGEGIIGLNGAISAVLEIVLFFCTHKIMRKTGILNLMIIDMSMVTLHWLIFSFTSSIPVILVVQFLTQPFSWAIFSYTLTVFVQRAVDERMHARAQAILNGIALSIGRFIGALGGSALINLFGEEHQQRVFLTISIVCFTVLCAAVCFFLKHGWRPNREPERLALHDGDAV